jgi:hypothetical protein
MKQRFTWLALLIFLSTVAIGQGPARDLEQNGPSAWPGFSREQPSPENILRFSLGDDAVLKLDSLVSGKSWKEKFLYDDMGNLTHQYYMEWEADRNQWLLLWGLWEYVYDAHGKMTQHLKHYWDFELHELVVLARTEYEYNDNGHLLASNLFHLDTENDWEHTFKSEFEYDEDGKMTRRIQSELNSSTGEWLPHFMSEYAYDDHGNIAEERIWERVFDWATETEQFRISLKREHIYFAAGHIMETRFFTWHVQAGQWVSYSRHGYDYDDDDRLVLFTAFDPVENGVGWVARAMEEYQYDLNGNMEQYSISDYDASSDQWIMQTRQKYLYDHSYLASELWLPLDYSHPRRGIFPVNMMTEFNQEYFDQGVMMGSTIFKMHYSSLSAFEATTVQDPGLTGYSVYPNPASDILQVRSSGNSGITRFELFDTQGRLLKALEFSGQVAISLSDFRSGIYLYSLTSNGSRQTGKIVRE